MFCCGPPKRPAEIDEDEFGMPNMPEVLPDGALEENIAFEEVVVAPNNPVCAVPAGFCKVPKANEALGAKEEEDVVVEEAIVVCGFENESKIPPDAGLIAGIIPAPLEPNMPAVDGAIEPVPKSELDAVRVEVDGGGALEEAAPGSAPNPLKVDLLPPLKEN